MKPVDIHKAEYIMRKCADDACGALDITVPVGTAFAIRNAILDGIRWGIADYLDAAGMKSQAAEIRLRAHPNKT